MAGYAYSCAVTPPLAHADPGSDLNEAQRAVVEHGQGMSAPPPLLVVAGAGTGKTTTLAARVARLLRDGADPQRLLLLSFSRRAAQSMVAQVGRMLHRSLRLAATQAAPRLPWAGTFHAVGARLLREHASAIGLPPDFSVHDRGDAEDLMGYVRQELELAQTHKRFPAKSTCLAIYSRVVNTREPLAQVLPRHFPWCAAWEVELRRLFQGYVDEKQRQHALDFDDLLLWWAQMLEEPALARLLAGRFDHVLVDEFQDTNRLQAAILQGLSPGGRGLTVVGDDAQSIYAFRGAEVRNILDFPRQFEPPARVLSLERNYRSTQPILAAANAVIALATERHDKTLWTELREQERPALVSVADESAQASWVVDQVLLRREGGLALKRQAVLFRAAHHSAELELELTRRDVPFVKFGGLRFLEASHVKDLLAVLRWALNPRSRLAAQRVALLLPGLGPASVRRLLASLEGAADPVAVVQAFRPPPAAAAAWADCMAMLASLRSDDWPAAVGRAAAWYRPQLERLHEDAAVRWSDLLTLERLASAQPSMERFVTELTLDPPEATSDEAGPPHRDDDYLILSTMHSAKGQEWTAVYLLNVVDGCIPSDMSTGRADEIEEERRLLHVAMTRARRHLALVMPQRFHVTQQRSLGDLHLYAGPSRFIPPTLAGHFDLLSATVGGPSAVAASGAAAHASASDALLASSPPAALDPALPPLARRVRSIF